MKKYSVNNVDVQADDFWNQLDEALEDEADGLKYDEWLDDISDGPIKIGFSVFNVSDILREMDPTTYREGKSDYVEQRREDCMYDLEFDGKTEVCGRHFQIVEKEETKN